MSLMKLYCNLLNDVLFRLSFSFQIIHIVVGLLLLLLHHFFLHLRHLLLLHLLLFFVFVFCSCFASVTVLLSAEKRLVYFNAHCCI